MTEFSSSTSGCVNHPPIASKKNRIVYIGGFLDEAIVKERGLPSHNAAGSNRMDRIANALKSGGYRPVILSPAASLRMNSKGAFLHPGRVRKRKIAPVVFAPAFNIFGINVLFSWFFQILCLRVILKSGRVSEAIIYNFNPSLILLCAYLKYVRRLPILSNIEDISIPSLKDWSRKTEARPVQQIVFYFCMNLIARMADGYIVPTRRFLNYLPGNTPSEIVTGCIEVMDSPDRDPVEDNDRLQVLYAGKLQREDGIIEFVRALQQLDALDEPPYIRVEISGTGNMADWVREQVSTLRTIKATYHGFVSTSDYVELLRRSQICVALHNPTGRYADFKTPSKMYEYLGYGKAVITTDAGDIRDMPKDSILILDRLEPGAIAEKLLWLSADSTRTAAIQAAARHHAKEFFSYAAVGTVLKDLSVKISKVTD